MESQTRLSRHNKFISAENITILSGFFFCFITAIKITLFVKFDALPWN